MTKYLADIQPTNHSWNTLVLGCDIWLCFLFAGTVHFRIPESSPVGGTIGSVKATDADIGRNAELEYRIIDGDGMDMFDIVTQKDTQEGSITVRKVPPIHINLCLFALFIATRWYIL